MQAQPLGKPTEPANIARSSPRLKPSLNPLVGADGYLVRLDELNADNSIKAKLFTSSTRSAPFGLGVTERSFNFHDAAGDPGVTIDAGIRLGILISRLGDNSDSAVAAVHGSEVAAGPRKTYDDASIDFDLENDVVYQHIDPGVDADTHSHGTDIRGNIKIFYTIIIDHGDLLGGAHELTQAQAEDDTSTVYGLVSGERLAESVAANETTGGGGGALTQATEATLGGVRGATALQAIASSGTAILGWTNNRIRQLISAALPAMAQSDIDNATAGRKSITGALLAANAGGGTDDQTAAEVSVDATGFTGNLATTDDDVQTALATIDALDISGGGSGGSADRIVLADAVGVSNTAGPHEIALTEAMVARQWISFFVFSSAAASPDGIGYLLSDDVLALTAEATAPTDAENALPVVTASYSASNFSQQSGNYFVYRKDDSTLWVRPTRLAAHTLTITATPMGGGALTTSEQESLSNARVLRSRTFPGEGNGIATPDSDTEWPTNSPNTFVVTATEYADVERIELLLRQNGKADIPIVITKGLLDGITAGAYMPNSPSNTTRIRGVFHYSRIGASNRDMNQPVYNPRFDLMEERREANDNCFLIQYGLNGTLLTALYIRARQPAGSLFFHHARLYYWEDA